MLHLNFDAADGATELARDEAMLVWADGWVNDHPDAPQGSTDSFRTWSFAVPTVVLGRSSKIDDETDREFCRKSAIEMLRRPTGGASVVGGPGCLMYSVVLRLAEVENLRKIDVAHDHVMQRVEQAVRRQQPNVRRQGICDLTIDDRKFSGNSLRVARHHLLYHGTILFDADLALIANCLAHAPRQPQYRQGRSHREFIGNLKLDVTRLVQDLATEFGVSESDKASKDRQEMISAIAEGLLCSRYRDNDWHTRR